MKFLYALFVSFFVVSFGSAQCFYTIPFTENFDGASWVVPPNTSQPGSIFTCWTRNPVVVDRYFWATGPTIVVNNFTGPQGDHTSGGGKFIFTESGFGTATVPYTTTILTPFISLVGSTSPELIFWYHMYGLQMGTLRVQVSTGGPWVTLDTKSGQQQTSNTSLWLKQTLSLAAYVGDTIRIRFEGSKANISTSTRIAIDDLSIAEAPTCAFPTNLYTSATTGNSTTAFWTAGAATSTSWEVQYGPVGFTLGSGTIITFATNSAVLTGLSGSTQYDIYVREVCGPTDKSYWVGPASATTSCSAALTVPYSENFDSQAWLPYTGTTNFGSNAPCWFANPSPAVLNYMWLVNPNLLFANNTGPSSDHTTGNGKYVATQSLAGNNSFAVLRSPMIDLSGVTNPELNFWFHMFGADISKLEVDVLIVGGTTWTNIYTKTGQQQSSSASPWQSASISLNAYANQMVNIRFKGTRSSTNGLSAKIAIDDISIVQGSSCPKPSSLSASNITSSSITINWTGTTGTHEVKYGPVGFDPNLTGTTVLANGSSKAIVGLTSNTTYHFYVRKLCTGGINSTWEGPLTASTFCLANAPYVQTFDDASWIAPTGFSNDIGTINNCYIRSQATTYIWVPGPTQFPSAATGPSVDHTTGTSSGKFMWTDSPSFGGSSPTAELTTELINLVPLNTPELSFWYHMYGNQIGTLKVEINNGSGWTQIFTKTGQQQNSKTAAWLEEVVNLSAYVDDTIRLRFTATKAVNGFNAEVAIDDIDIHELPSCPKPSNVLAAAPTFNSVGLSWTTGGATRWLVKYGAPGFTSGTISAVGTNPFTLNGLSPNTNYELWIRDSCGVGDVSQWVGPLFFNTGCLPFTAPYSQNFDGSTFVPWTFASQPGTIDPCFRRSSTAEYYWVPGPPPNNFFNTGPSSGFGGSGKFMYTRTSLFQADLQTTFTTPWIDISTLTAAELRFQYHMYGSGIDKLEVRAQAYDGTLTFLTTITGQQQTSKTAAWLQKTQSLSALTSDTVRLLFTGYRVVNGFQAEIAIDEIEVSNPQNCVTPTALTATNITVNSVQLNWTKGAAAFSSNVEYGPTGFTPGSGTVIHAVNSPYVVTGLASSTAYQFYIQDSCAWGGLSPRLGPVAATTLACPAVASLFTANTSTGLSVAFNSTSTGTIANYAWTFGDGNTDNIAAPTHVYATGGVYTVTLVVTSACGSSSTSTQTINVCDAVIPQFSTSFNGLTASFDATATTGTGLTYDWLYGDGTTGTGLTSTHTYAADGNYSISLITTDACGNIDTLVQSMNICSPAIAVLNYTQNGLDVNFDASSSIGAVQFQWNFGDGSTNTNATYLHTYAATGTYQITLYTTNLCGDRDTATLILTLCSVPKASWTYTIISSGGSGMTVQFDGTASIGASSYVWNFGDGTTNTTSAIPTHTYSVPGLFYVVTLTVANSCGDENSSTSSLASIGVEDFEKAGLIVFPNPVDNQLVVQIPAFLELSKLKLVNALGQIVVNDFSLQNGQIVVQTADLAEGNYFLILSTNAGEAVYQLVVKH